MVLISFQQSNELLDTQYYDREVAYQQYIDAAKNASKLKTNIQFAVANGGIEITIPTELKNATAQIELIAMHQARNDIKKTSKIKNGIIRIENRENKISGKYRYRILIEKDNTKYYYENSIYL